MTFLGADTDQLRETASAFERGAASLEALLTSLSGVVSAVDWQGPDADRFRSDVDQLLRQALTTTGRVSKRATALEEEAEEQDEASSGGDAVRGTGQGGLNPLDRIRRVFDGLSSPDETAGATEKIREVSEKIFDKVADKVGDSRELPTWVRRLTKGVAAGVNVYPEVEEMYQHLAAGETGLAIGDGFEIVWGGAPHPVAALGSMLNEEFTGPGEDDTSPFEKWGQIQEESFGARYGEKVGGDISHLLGFEDEGTMDNLITSGGGVAGWTTFSAFGPTGFLNQASGVWNSRD
ncbi:WXG100 family type VII secretion target [Brachybacterium paraconglomeratum]|uniref:WXG100 family type VII secretion target n=1 Tax=Brachybacterium paraconglomeratum TaxID=173362 RepID=UPI0037CA8D71